MLIDIIFAARLARGDQDRVGQRIVGGDQPGFGRHMVAGGDDDPFFRGGEADGDAEAFIILMEKFDVARDALAQPMEPRIVGAPIVIGDAVEQPLAVAGPHQR